MLLLAYSTPTPHLLYAAPLKKKKGNQLNNRLDILSLFPAQFLPSRCLLKKAHSCPISRGSLSSYAESIAHHSFAFIILTISPDSRWHYATCCNTITSLSHVSVVVKGGYGVFQHIQMSPRTRERHPWTSFLCQTTQSHRGWLAVSNYFMPLGSACTGRRGIVLEKSEEDWQPGSIPQELIRLPD